MYEFTKTFFGKNYDDKQDWFAHKTLIHFLPHGTFIEMMIITKGFEGVGL
jgi:hypothetical protein